MISPDKIEGRQYNGVQSEASLLLLRKGIVFNPHEYAEVVDDTEEFLRLLNYRVRRQSVASEFGGRIVEGELITWETDQLRYGLIFSGEDIYVSDSSSQTGFTELGTFHLNRQSPFSPLERSQSLNRLDDQPLGMRAIVAYEYAQGQKIAA